MEHLAIDLGGKESQICVRSSDGQIVEERRCRTAMLPAYLATRPRSRVVVETCSEAFGVADAALGIGHEVRVVPGTLVRSLGVGARRVKTDRRDARVLSEVSCRIDLPSVHVPSRLAREFKSLCGSREILIKARTMLIRIAKGTTPTFQVRLRAYAQANELSLPPHIERQLVMLDALKVQIKE